MMIEFWWKVLLASLVTVGIAKLFDCPLGILLLFALAWIGWTIGLLLCWNLLDYWKWWRERR